MQYWVSFTGVQFSLFSTMKIFQQDIFYFAQESIRKILQIVKLLQHKYALILKIVKI